MKKRIIWMLAAILICGISSVQAQVMKVADLEKYAKELLAVTSPETTHKYYWEKPIKRKVKPSHPGENDESLPDSIRGKHFESWTDLARELGYHE